MLHQHQPPSFSKKTVAKFMIHNELFCNRYINLKFFARIPEYQVLSMISEKGELSHSELIAKFKSPYSLSMVLGRLQAYDLITSITGDIWKLSENVIKAILHSINHKLIR